MRRLFSIVVASFVLSVSGPAQAAWHVAKSKHFVIYANQRPEDLRKFSVRLEKFDQAVRRAIHLDDFAFGDGNRLTVFVVPNEAAVQKLSMNKDVSGFYVPRASGSLAFVPQRAGYGDEFWNEDIIFFHEYAHHLMMQDLERPYPEWLVEGFAEFMSTARFEKNGSVLLGAPAQHRAYSLATGKPIALEKLLSGDYSDLSTDDRTTSVYARGWLLTHYLVFDPAREGQIGRYLSAIANGTPALQAATGAFGDLKQLDRDLKTYLRKISNSAMTMRIAAERAQPGPVEVAALSPGAAAVLPLRFESKRGVDSKTAEALAVKVRQIQARYPGDELVEVTLAEAELDAGHPEAAEAAAGRALKANPRNTEALIYKGRALVARAEQSQGAQHKALIEQGRATLIAANKIDPEDPEPLLEFFNTFAAAGQAPTANALEALHYASDLVPQDSNVRINSAIQHVVANDLKTARRTLAPLAYNPHGGAAASVARAMIVKIDQGDKDGALKALQAGSSSNTATK